jgi:carboxyl-terminal processing protease
MRANGFRSLVAMVWVALAVAACGGGGGGYGGGGGGGGSGGPPANPIYTMGNFQPPSTYAAYCAVPRTGTDPNNHNQPYPDRLGSTVWENFWIRSWSNAYYLWYRDLQDINPASYNTTDAYFKLMKSSATNPSGTPKDKPGFHFTYNTAQWEALAQSGVAVGYGLTWELVALTPPRAAFVAYTEPATSGYPATSANVHLARGASIIAVDGVDLVNGSDIATLNAGLFPATAGEMHSFTVIDAPGSPSRVVSMTAVDVTETPVQNARVLPGTTIGYLLFNDHIATAEPELMAAISSLAQAGITDLVLDIRYNGGGYLDIASELAYMVAGSAKTAGKTFDLLTFNDKYPTTDPILNQPITPTPFWSTTQGFSGPSGQALPALNLARVFVLTGNDTCSASEAIINSLNGIGVTVVQIGSQTCGKPYGFYPQDNCGTTYFSIEFKGVNQANFGDYPDGFAPAVGASTVGLPVILPGCLVADDFTHALGDPAESRLAAALAYIGGGQTACPTPATGLGAPPSAFGAEGHVAKPEWLKNRILRRPR